jgi:hypothetical protein
MSKGNPYTGLARYFKILDKIHYTGPIRWNSKKDCLGVNPSPQKFLWTVGAICSFIMGIACLVYVALEQGFVREMKLSLAKHGVPLIVLFFVAMHALPPFLHTMFVTKKYLVQEYNHIVELEKQIVM